MVEKEDKKYSKRKGVKTSGLHDGEAGSVRERRDAKEEGDGREQGRKETEAGLSRPRQEHRKMKEKKTVEGRRER